MREWLSDRRRLALLSGTVVAASIVIGVIWGAADAGGVEATATTTATTTTVLEVESPSTTEVATTTIVPVTTSSLADSGSTTAPRGGGTSGTGGGSGGSSGGGSDPTPVANEPPSIEDPGISSDGMRLNVAPLIADPDSDSLNVEISAVPGGVETCEGCPPGPLKGAQFRYDPSEVGFATDVVVSIRVVDEAGNQIAETFEHRLLAITTVNLRANFNMTGATSCFADQAAVRLVGEIVARGPINDTFGFSAELRPDRARILILEASEEVVGERAPPLAVSFNAALDEQVDSTEREFTRSDQVLENLFANQLCRGSLVWTVEFDVR